MSSILLVYFYFFYLLFLAILTWLNFFTPLILTIIRAIYLLVIIYNVQLTFSNLPICAAKGLIFRIQIHDALNSKGWSTLVLEMSDSKF